MTVLTTILELQYVNFPQIQVTMCVPHTANL